MKQETSSQMLKGILQGCLLILLTKKGLVFLVLESISNTKNTRPFLLSNKGLEFLVLESISIPKVLGPF